MKELFLVSLRKYAVLAVLTGCFLWTGSGFSQSGVVAPPQTSDQTKPGTGPAAAADPSQDAATASASQTKTVLQSTPVSDEVLYRMFFRFVATVDELADKLEKEGKPEAATAWRNHVRQRAGLNELEGTLMKEIAFDCNKTLTTSNAELKTAITGFRATHPRSTASQALMSPELSEVRTSYEQITSSHLERLKVQLGQPSFDKLDAFVRDLFKASATISPVDQQATPAAKRIPRSTGGRQ
jgi:hypothetical protein